MRKCKDLNINTHFVFLRYNFDKVFAVFKHICYVLFSSMFMTWLKEGRWIHSEERLKNTEGRKERKGRSK